MTTPFPFVAGQVLTAAQLNDIQNLPISDKTASYTLVVADVTKRTIMNNAGATTITVDNSIFTVGDVIQVANKGAGTCTITAGAGVTINTSGSLALAQYGGGYLLALSASTFTFFNLGGGSAYGTATGGIGSPTSVTISSVNYQYLTFTSTGTLTVTKAGFFDYLAVGGGGGSFYYPGAVGGGGGAGQVKIGSVYLSANQTITIGAGGAIFPHSGSGNFTQGGDTSVAATSPFTQTALGNMACFDPTSVGTSPYVGGGVGCLETTQRAITESTANGYRGGLSGSIFNSAGGGGGNTARGGTSSGNTGGTGGAGYDVSAFIGGSALFKAMGGGGGGVSTGGTAATNGVAGSANLTPPNGNVNSGGGGGGGKDSPCTSGAGGSGICYIRWKV